MALIDLLVEGFLAHLSGRGSWFAKPDFPYAETWWWNFSALEVRNEWILDFLSELAPPERPAPEPSLAGA